MPKASQMKDERLEIRVKPDDKKLLEEAATITGISVSSFVTLHSLKAAKQEIGENKIVLSKRDAELFVKMLENPPKANAYLKESFEDFRKKFGIPK